MNMVNHENSVNFQYGKWLSSPPPGEEVVISGISGRFPQCNNVQDLLDNLLAKRDLMNENNLRWSVQHPELPKRVSQIPNLCKFDAGFFGLHQRQVENMDQNLQKLLEVSVESVLDAGVHPEELENSRTGVFIGFTLSEMAVYKAKRITQPDLFALTGYMTTMISNRISYFFKVKGPSICVDTACSSSLGALENAFNAIRCGRCDQALVGGAELIIHPIGTLQFHRLGIVSKDGISKVFDQEADGYVRAESTGCIFLQKAKDSKRIYAQVVHCKLNSDGFKFEGHSSPSQKLQCHLLEEIYQECGIKPDQLSYFEAHATGTRVGDEVELRAIDDAIGRHRKKPLWIGSVKSNLGHAEGAAGIVSIIKVLLAMHCGFVGPNLHFKKAKTEVDNILQNRLIPVTDNIFLEEEAIVGVNNFGLGGINAHVVLRRICRNKNEKKYDCSTLICASGRTKESVEEIFEKAIQHKDDPEWVALIHNVFKRPFKNHLFRGFIIIRKNKPPITSVQLSLNFGDVGYVKFGYFQKNYEVLEKYLSTLPLFTEKLLKIREKFLSFHQKGGQYNSNTKAVIVQLCIVEVLKVLDLSPVVILDDFVADSLKNNTILKDIIVEKNDIDVANNMVLDLSDANTSLLDNPDTLLEIIGRLFEHGHTPQLHKLYPTIEYPVHSSTPMISPSIKWNHTKNWPTEFYTSLEGTTTDMFEIDLNDSQYQYIKDYVLDGRNLFPTTGYLYMVWQVLAEKDVMKIDDYPVVFTNCRFIKATTLTKNTVSFKITIQKGSGNFEILTEDLVVVTGKVSQLKERQAQFLQPVFRKHNPKEVMDTFEIYKELNLRGYNYTGQFKALRKCNLEATEGLLEWQNNWVTFVENMIQMKLLQPDTRVLSLPTSIQTITIDTLKHFKEIDSANGKVNLPLIANDKCNIIKSGGVEIYGLLTTPILRKQHAEPVLEKYEFVPNITLLDLAQSVGINTQIIVEESLEVDIKAVEVIDEFTNPKNSFCMPLIYATLERIRFVRPHLTISSQKMLQEVPGIKMEFVKLTPTSDLLLIVATKVLEQNERLKSILGSLEQNGFVLSREEKTFVPKKIDGITILTQHILENEQLILLRKCVSQDNTYVEISPTNLSWISQLQKYAENSPSIIIYSQHQQNSGILGLINSIRREPGGKKIKCFFMMDDAPQFDPLNPFYAQQIIKNQAINIYKNSKWGTYRYLPLDELPFKLKEHSYVSSGDTLSSLRWIEGPLRYDNGDQNLVYTYYSALNPRDVMISSGRLTIMSDRRVQDCQVGLEYSGKDSKGNRVMGLVSCRGLSNIIRVDPALRFSVPLDWSLEDAATVPYVYATVIYALLMRVTLKRGASILIHSAAGDVGIAALNVTLHYDCNVFVTVGTEEGRNFLKKTFPQVPDSRIGHSRNTSFEKIIKKETKGCGVDIVLNSLAGEKLESSMRCLAHGGIFIEIGKSHLFKNNVFNLLLMKKEASYHGVMLDEIFKSTDRKKLEVRNKVYEGIQAGYVKPIPRNVLDHEDVNTVFKYMETGIHIGKILIKIREEGRDEVLQPPKVLINAVPRFYCNPEKSYIIVGGLGGFGLELADWLVLRGAKKVILTSRFGILTGYHTKRIQTWTSYGARIHVFTTPTSTKQEYLNLIRESNRIGPIDGIFNLAVVLKDALFKDQTEANFKITQEPKVEASKFLDEISRKHCPHLRCFVVFSSALSGSGNAGQTNYGMANSVMERICEERKQEGLPGLAIQWGAVGDVGIVAKMQRENKEFAIGGTSPQKISSCLDVMDLFLNQNNPVVISMVVADKRDKVSARTPLEAVAKIIGIKNLKTVSYQATLAEMGMDSIMGTEIIEILGKDFGIPVTAVEARNLTVTKLIEMETEIKSRDKN